MPRYRNKRGRPKTRNKKKKPPSLSRNTGRKQGWNLKKGQLGQPLGMKGFITNKSDGDWGRNIYRHGYRVQQRLEKARDKDFYKALKDKRKLKGFYREWGSITGKARRRKR